MQIFGRRRSALIVAVVALSWLPSLSAQTGPQFTAQPRGINGTFSGPAVFTANVVSATTYQWRKGGINIPGATATEFRIPSITTADRGTYSLFCTGPSGTAESRHVLLEIYEPRVAGQIDATFEFADGVNGWINTVNAVVEQPDGKLIIGGGFDFIQGVASRMVGRLTATGSYDPSFNVGGGANSDVRALALQSDGKVLVGGQFDTFNGSARKFLVRLNANGSLDTSFNPTFTTPDGRGIVWSIVSQPDGKILIGGRLPSGVIRLEANGTVDQTFNPGVGANGDVYGVAILSDGKILLNGLFTTFGGAVAGGVARLNSNGSRDNSFLSGSGAGDPGIVSAAVQPDGKILLSGGFSIFNGNQRARLVRLNADGSLDAAFVPSSAVTSVGVFGLAVATNGLIYLDSIRLQADGRQDSTYRANTGMGVQSLKFARDGRLLACGTTYSSPGSLFSGGVVKMATTYPAEPVSIVTQPKPASTSIGESIQLPVEVAGTGPFTYQWLKNGAQIPGATGAVLSLSNVQPNDAASYSVVISNAAGSVTSTAANLLVVVPVAPSIIEQPNSITISAGSPAQLSVTASGTAPLTFRWFKDGTGIPNATSNTLIISGAQVSDSGSYTVTVSNGVGNVTSDPARVTVNPPEGRISNLSVRTALSAADTLIVGIVVSGDARDVLIRAAGPALTGLGVAGAMSDPRLDIYADSTLIFENDDWPSSLAATFTAAGAFPFPSGSRDAALQQKMSSNRSIQVRGRSPGVVLVEAYDVGSGTGGRLVNVSARNRVGLGDEIFIAGFTVTGSSAKMLLLRAVGPRLGSFGVTNFLSDPRIELFAGRTKLNENDNWQAALGAVFTSVGAFPLEPGSLDAALVAQVPPGSYTVQVRGNDGGSGEALVEIYELP